MKIQKILFLVYVIFLSCSNGENNLSFEKEEKIFESEMEVTFVSVSEDMVPFVIRKDVTFQEELNGEIFSDTIRSNETVKFKLNEKFQIVYGTLSDEYQPDTFLVKTGDTLILKYLNKRISVIKMNNGNYVPAKWGYSEIIPITTKMATLDSFLTLFFTREKIERLDFLKPNLQNKYYWKSNFAKYKLYSEKYYLDLIDSLRLRKDELSDFYANLIMKKQITELSSVLNIINNDSLNRDFYNQFLTNENFNNRFTNGVFGGYFFKEIQTNKKLNLQAEYQKGFPEFPDLIARYFKASVIRTMDANKYGRKTIIDFLNRYKYEYGNFYPLQYLLRDLEYGIPTSSDLILMNIVGDEFQWEELKEQWKGKVLYVDFWASWCAPCLRVMPNSVELKNNLSNERIVFVYLALNDRDILWKEFANKYNITDNNFLIRNSKTSQFILNHKIEAIPRYMIFDSNGSLIHNDAPGPETKEIKGILERLVENN